MLNREILVVDDEKDLRTMIRSIFESAGYTQITTAASGQEALAVMAKKIPGSILRGAGRRMAQRTPRVRT